MLLQALLLIVSIVLLYYGAEVALDAAERVGRFLGFSSLTIGLLIIGFGTSLPEFFVSQLASYRGMSGIAFGNIIGSNIANLFLVMGVAGLLVTLGLKDRDVRSQLWFHVGLSIVLYGILYRGKIDFVSLSILLVFFLSYLGFTLLQMKKYEEEEENKNERVGWLDFVKLNLGFALLYGGGELLVYSGSGLGSSLGISEYVISAIFVAFGTSFPELVTAILACYRKKDFDLITGNIIGSNIFNVAFVLMSLGIYQIDIQASYLMEASLLVAVAVLLLILSLLGRNFTRVMALLFISSYVGMIFYWIR